MDISPDKQNIDTVFSNTRYYIDFYQRQYKWTDVPLRRLLDDIFYKFNVEYDKHKDSDIPIEQQITKYNWYYLNTYVTNKSSGKLFVVDGQQRLTTLMLILIKLHSHSQLLESGLTDWLSNKIVGHSGYKAEYWMNHENHLDTIESLYKGTDPDQIKTEGRITSRNMVSNYKIISKRINEELQNKTKFDVFTFYFLHRIVLISLNVEQTDVPMVFEVINDRGLRLKPYEILKGKLLGQIDKEELDQLHLNTLWDAQIKKVNAYADDDIDQFFTYYLKAKLSNSRSEAQKFDIDYHRVMFTSEINQVLKLDHNAKQVKRFLVEDFFYFSQLYCRVRGLQNSLNKDYSHTYFNGLTDMSTQYLLILSCCSHNDAEEDSKIKLISYHLDRLFCLLQLQRAYNSNDFATIIYKISFELRNQPKESIRPVFEKHLLDILTENRGVVVGEPFVYSFFKDTGIELEKRFKRYLFARVELFLADKTNMEMRHSINNLVLNTGSKNGFHVEHILADNDENITLFKHDQELFDRERNRLGGLLLLKGKDNQSSNNESYAQKLATYANTLYWNETLRHDNYKSKKDFDKMMSDLKLSFRAMDTFGPDELEERHKLLFEMTKLIWE